MDQAGIDELYRLVGRLSRRLEDIETQITRGGSPSAHASSHENAGSDEISVAGLSGLLADGQTPLAHKTTHQDGGSDEISVAGLSGVLADRQDADKIQGVDVESGAPDDRDMWRYSSSNSQWEHTKDIHSDDCNVEEFFILESASATISGGAITATCSHMQVDTEGGAATDDLDTINGGTTTGTILIIRSTSSDRDITLKDGTGNLVLAGDFTLTNTRDTIVLIRTGIGWLELSRSDNA